MKNIFILCVAVVLAACDQRQTYIESLNSAPTLTLVNQTNGIIGLGLLSDSIKLSLKNTQKFYPLTLKQSDINNNIVSTTFYWQTGSGKIIQDGNAIVGTTLNSTGSDGLLNLQVWPDHSGLSRIIFTTTDIFNATAKFTLELTGFINLTPVAVLKISSNPVYDPLQYTLDASLSYDRDTKYGGGLSGYIFTVGNQQPITTVKPTIQFVFDKKGYFVITLQVIDNDGAASSIYTQTYLIN